MKTFMLVSMWLAASAAAVGVAWAGVSVVDDQIVDPPSAAEFASPTSATPTVGDATTERDNRTSLEEPNSVPTTDSIPEAADDANGQSSPSTRAPRQTTLPSHTSTTVRSTLLPTTVSTPQPAPTAKPSTTSSTASTATNPSPSTTAPPPASMTQTFTLTGGTAAISFSSSGVEVLWATPNPGFDVSIEPESPGLKVEFRADHHRSRVDAWWSGGPQHSIREEPRD